MGMQDRDYYKDAWKKRDRGDIQGYHHGSSQSNFTSKISKKSSKFNYFWLFVFTVGLCGIIFIILKIIAKGFT